MDGCVSAGELDGYNLKAQQVRDRKLFATQQRNIEDPSHFRSISLTCDFGRLVQLFWLMIPLTCDFRRPRKQGINKDGPADLESVGFWEGHHCLIENKGSNCDSFSMLLNVSHFSSTQSSKLEGVIFGILLYPNYASSESQVLVENMLRFVTIYIAIVIV